MANILGTPGGESGKLNELYRDQGDGSYTSQVAALQYVWDSNNLVWVRLDSLDANLRPSNATSSAYEASRVVKAAAGTLRGLTGYNSGPAQFIQIHDAAAVPADTAVPKIVFAIATLTPFSLNYDLAGRAFATGIVVCNSSTGPTKTVGSADCWFDVQYL